MKTLYCGVLLSWVVWPTQQEAEPARTTVQLVLTQVLRAPDLAPFLAHYVAGPTYFRLLPTAAYTPQALRQFRSLQLRIGPQAPLRYSETKDARRYPVVEFHLVQLTATSAEVWVGLAVEGVVGKFTLVKRPTWTLLTTQVYER